MRSLLMIVIMFVFVPLCFSQSVQDKKESLYDHVHVSVKTMDRIIWVVSILLAIVVILIILEASGVFKL